VKLEGPFKTHPLADKACPACGLVCASRQSRNRHIQRAHADIAEALLAESASQTPMDPGQEDKVVSDWR